MSQSVTLNLPESLLSAAELQAQRDARPLEAVLLEWLNQGADLPVASLGDEQVLELTRLQLSENEQTRLSTLLEQQRESLLTPTVRSRTRATHERLSAGFITKSRGA